MKKLILVLILGLFTSSITFADILPDLPPNSKAVKTTLKVQGLNEKGETADGSILVVVITSRSKFVAQVRNNQPIAKYRNEAVQLFLVSAELLSKMGNNINNINFSKEHAGLTAVPIEVLSEEFTVNENSPISEREITYTFK